ncbi:MAG: exodeoxyribonuclease III [Chloroflexi bacterium]|nr:exodeoxyribonuclease III [Chloroflexota bacterium]
MTSSPLTLLSWNVNGARAIYKKGFMPWLAAAQPDILCLQETRAESAQLPADLRVPDGYHAYWNPSIRKRGYSGTGLLTRLEPQAVEFGLGQTEFDQEGRTIIAHYADFTLVNCYFPNGSRDHKRVPFKLAFYEAFLQRMEEIRAAGRPLIFCGDVNTAHQAIDLARPRSNAKTTGFLPEERAWIDQVVAAGYVDTFRHFYPDLAEQYTWWSMPTRARERNVGWRIDYFFASAELIPVITDAWIWANVMGSDHCPVGISLQAQG